MAILQDQTIGAYQIIGQIGQGGMATVYKAYHPRLNRYVAIKMIHPAYLQDAGFVARFEREAQIVAALDHPNIAPVHDFSEHNGQPYLVMKYIDGCSLKDILLDGPIELRDIMMIAPRIAAALDYAHGQGVLHRDIKPSNVMLDSKGTAYLTDFGLAKIVLAGESTMSQDMMIGTPLYMSPEQAQGGRELDSRSDLYSFGIVLYELLTGKVPFSSGTGYTILHDHIFTPLPPPSEVNPEIPASVDLILLKALAKAPQDRYTTAIEMVKALRDALIAANIRALSSQGRHAASDSIARRRDVAVNTPPPVPAAVSSGVNAQGVPNRSQLGTPVETIQSPTSTRRQHPWVWLLLGAVLATVALVLLFARSRPSETPIIPTLASLPVQQLPPPPLAGEQPPSDRVGSFSWTRYEVPALSLTDAEARAAANQTDPLAYLALARAQLQLNQTSAASETIQRGAQYAEGTEIDYWLSAAHEAETLEAYGAAFTLYREVLRVASRAPEITRDVGEFVGERMYAIVSVSGTLSIAQIAQLREDEGVQREPIVTIMLGRALISDGNLRLAQTLLGNPAMRRAPQAELNLVRGELLAAQGDTAGALNKWEPLVDSTDSASWVRDRAAELIALTSQ